MTREQASGPDEPSYWAVAAAALVASRDAPERFSDFASRVQGFLFGCAYRLMGNFQDAQDVVQEALVKVFYARHSFQPERDLRAWLKTLVHHAAVDFLRKKGRQPAGQELEGVVDPRPSGVQCLASREAFSAAWGQLTPEEQTVLRVYHIEGAGTYAECAPHLGMTVEAFTRKLYRARLHFGELLREQGIDI
jgi:RNA polymerase sigma-70 factor (ECF subfamily)